MNKIIFLLIFLSALVTGVLIFLSFAPKKISKVQPAPSLSVGNSQKQTILFFDPATSQILPSDFGKKMTTQIEIDTGSNVVATIQLELQFDPQAITNVVIHLATESAFLGKDYQVLYSRVDQSAGRVSLFFNTQTLKGKGPIATLSFVSHSASGSSSITFLDKTMVSQRNSFSSVLKNTQPFSIK